MKSFLLQTIAFTLITASAMSAAAEKLVLQAEEAAFDSQRLEVVEQSSFKSGKGVTLKTGANSTVDSAEASSDLVLKARVSEAGRYQIRTHASVNDAGRERMAKAKSKHESMFMRIAVGKSRPVKRVVFVPWSAPESCFQTSGKFDLSGEEQEIRVWLPEGVILDYLEISTYVSPKVPKAAAEYRPKLVPPSSHPRLWVNQESLSKVKANLTRGENAQVWRKVRKAAEKPFEFTVKPNVPVEHNAELETAAVNKAFLYLMSGDKDSGRKAISLVNDYLGAVEFNNLLDITREIGRAIYAGARVYDWCYDLMSKEERESIRKNLMRLADDMEIGWPPFDQGVVNGHGAEAQLHCHLLSMAIAIYDEDPIPYQYCSYRILEELVPMRNFEYQSPRHNQGIGYGIYRFGWDMHAAWLMYRMSGEKVFDSNIEDVHKYWLYMRLPNGHSFPDGDGNVDGRRVNLGPLALLTGAYANDPLMKRDFVDQGGLPHDPLMVLLLNDPDLKPAEDLSSLPLTLDFGPILGGMVARTGWQMGEKGSSDVIAFMTGGGYHFANHQHADAGSFQIYYRGVQVADLGQYVFYGTPYDTNFNKRSISHSMMLAVDPEEKFGGKLLNDGGARYGFSSPMSLNKVKSNPVYANGKIVSSSFGPSEQQPLFSYFSVDLTSAYSKKIRSYIRTFCFLNLGKFETPAALVILDNMETRGPEVKKYWQVNTLKPPTKTDDGVVLSNNEGGETGNVVLRMLLPTADNRKVDILSGKEANSVFGHKLIAPKADAPQAHGHRIMFSPIKEQASDVFLTVLTMSDAYSTTLPVEMTELPHAFVLSLANWTIVLSRSGKLLEEEFTVSTRHNGEAELVLTGLTPGTWTIAGDDGKFHEELQVLDKKNTACVVVPKGEYKISPATSQSP